MDDQIKESLLKILSIMKVQAGFLSDSLVRVEALHLFLVNRDSLPYSEYKSLLEQASRQGDATLPLVCIKEIDEMIRTISGTPYIQ